MSNFLEFYICGLKIKIGLPGRDLQGQ